MQSINSKLLIAILFLAFVVSFAGKVKPANAQGGGTVTLSPSCTSCQVGSNLTVTVSVSASGSAIGAVEVNLNYDKTKLSFGNITHFSDANDFADILSEKADQSIGAIHIEAGKQGGLPDGSSGRIFAATFSVIAVGSASFSAAPLDGANQDGRVTLIANSLSVSLELSRDTDSSESGSDTGVNSGSGTGSSTPTPSGKTGTSTPKVIVNNYSKSEISFDKANVLPDGSDKACATILVKNNGKIVTNLKPTIKTEGGLDLSTITLSKDSWSTCASSTVPGSKRVMISIGGTLLKDQTLSFNSSFADQAKSTTDETLSANTAGDLIKILAKVRAKADIGAKKDIFSQKSITSIDLVKISGTAEPGTKLKIYIHSPELIQKEVAVGSDGKWSVQLDQGLTPGAHRAEAAVIDKYGTESDAKLIARFTVEKSYFRSIIIALSSFALFAFALVFYIVHRKRNLLALSQAQAPFIVADNPTSNFYPQQDQANQDVVRNLEQQENIPQPIEPSSIGSEQIPAINSSQPGPNPRIGMNQDSNQTVPSQPINVQREEGAVITPIENYPVSLNQVPTASNIDLSPENQPNEESNGKNNLPAS